MKWAEDRQREYVSSSLESVFETDWQAGIFSRTIVPRAFHESRVPRFYDASNPKFGADSMNFVASPQPNNPANVNDSLTALTQLIGQAKNTLKIQVYELSTTIYKSSQHWNVSDNAVRAAAARGVHVQVLVDKAALKAGRKDLEGLDPRVPNIQVQVVTVPQWSHGEIPYARLVHSKYFVIDGTTAWVGTRTREGSYFTGSRNVGLVFNSPALAGQIDSDLRSGLVKRLSFRALKAAPKQGLKRVPRSSQPERTFIESGALRGINPSVSGKHEAADTSDSRRILRPAAQIFPGAMIVEATGTLARQRIRRQIPFAASNAVGSGRTAESVLPRVQPMKKRGVTSPPLKPEPNVIVVKRSLAMKSNGDECPVKDCEIVSIPKPIYLVVPRTQTAVATMIPPTKGRRGA